MKFAGSSLFAASVLFASAAFAATYTEAGNGDLSGDRTNPTTFTLAEGTNTLTATTVANDEDYVKIVVPAMKNLQSITLTAYDGAATKSFIGFQSGNTFTETVAAPDPTKMLGYCHFGGANSTAEVKVGGNMLVAMKNGVNGFGEPIGYTTPLAAGDYTFWLHETNANARTYTLTFTVAANTKANTPELTPVGGSFADEAEVTMSTTTSGATIYYTLNGSTPTTSSLVYTTPLILTINTTVKAMAHDGVLTDSDVATETYVVTPTPAPALKVIGSKVLKVTRPKVKIKGTATNATSLTYQVGKGPKKPVSGTSSWNFTASKLKLGKNVITIRATGKKGTATTRVTVTYKP